LRLLHWWRAGVLAALVIVLAGAPLAAQQTRVGTSLQQPAHHLAHGFRNLDAHYHYSMVEHARRLIRQTLRGWPARGPRLTVVPNDGQELRGNGTQPTVTWIGHATLLVQLDGINILTDPHWGSHAAPFEVGGSRRLVPPGLRFEDLPQIHAVVISHDHYDHLDLATVKRLAREHAPRFFVPLGLKPWLVQRGITDVVELDWWQAASLGPVTFVSTPAQHSSGRSLADQNSRLWSSWVVAGRHHRLLFGGDSGYYDGFKEIGRRYGPLDLAILPIGGYSVYAGHHPNHMDPEEAVQAFEDLGAHLLVPMHWGTFELNREPFREPPDRLLHEAEARGIETDVAVLSPGQTIPW
jgi:N-acyl-phosphatidylethanolamine-hydrolysing phospholipase D